MIHVFLSIILPVLLLIGLILYLRQDVLMGADMINNFLSNRCRDPPILNSEKYPCVDELEQNWQLIKDEYNKYQKKYEIPSYSDISEKSSGNTPGWKSIFLRIFNRNLKICDKFPKTMSIINKFPCTSAYFSVLEPGTYIKPHYGIYKGVIRCHLAIEVPKDWKNVFLLVETIKLNWREGKCILFDDMFLHAVKNNTNQRRVVLFLDIERDFGSWYMNLLNKIFIKFIHINNTLINVVKKANQVSQILKPRISNNIRQSRVTYSRNRI